MSWNAVTHIYAIHLFRSAGSSPGSLPLSVGVAVFVAFALHPADRVAAPCNYIVTILLREVAAVECFDCAAAAEAGLYCVVLAMHDYS